MRTSRSDSLNLPEIRANRRFHREAVQCHRERNPPSKGTSPSACRSGFSGLESRPVTPTPQGAGSPRLGTPTTVPRSGDVQRLRYWATGGDESSAVVFGRYRPASVFGREWDEAVHEAVVMGG